MSNNIYGIKDSANFTVKYKANSKTGATPAYKAGDIFIYADYATVSTNEWGSEQVYARSKSVNAIRWDYGRNSTLKADMEIFDLRWIAMVFGSDFKTDTNKEIFKRDKFVLTAKGDGESATINDVELSYTPVTNSVSVFILEDDGLTNGTKLEGATDYTLTDKKITFKSENAVAGKSIAVFYATKPTIAKTLTINADDYPINFEIVADTMIRDTDGVDKFVQINYLNVKPKSQFTLTMDANSITTLSVEFDILKDTASSDMATYTIYE